MQKLIIFALLFFGVADVTAQRYTPMELCKKIMSKDTLPDIKKYCSGDFTGHPNGSDFPPGVKISLILLNQTEQRAVINVNLSDTGGIELDTYFHFEKDTIWKATAFRALAMTGIIAKVHADLAALSAKQVDSVLASPHTLKKDNRMFKSYEEYRFTLGNTKLTLASDNELISYFSKNKQAFDEIRDRLITSGINMQPDGTRGMKRIDDIRRKLRMLFIDNVYPNSESTHNTLNFLIGGIIDNSVGYLYIKESKNVPEMTGDHFIMIKPIGDGWYLYKTT